MTSPRTTKMSPAKAAAAEAAAETITIRYNGDDYTVARDALDSIGFLEAAQDGKDVVMIRELLGPVQWVQFRAKNKSRTDTLGFAEAFGEAVGTGN